ncbi:hypothetical protein C2G38_2214613 [Gigaspora rosea]|uniref:DUF7729 domain-containing protein n=1 Tax=Gigaspora rosea TaxID=44941 RepID=A0A397UE77_9GLOM|nr:hypothetical protein C2G38_2214613 [Gigaspora rosea]
MSVLLALTDIESTILSNITSIPPPKDNRFNLGNLSASCEDALSKIVLSCEFLTCVPIPALLPLVPMIPEIGNIKKNLREFLNYLDPIDQFSNIICLVPRCSEKGVQSAIQEILNRCTTELNKNNTIVGLIYGAAVFYSPLRDSICFKNNNVFCIHETANITFTLPNPPFNITDNTIIEAIAFANPEQVCTQCNKDIINTFGNFLENNTLALQVLAQAGINQILIDTMKIGIAVKCGINFEDGEVPNNPSQ